MDPQQLAQAQHQAHAHSNAEPPAPQSSLFHTRTLLMANTSPIFTCISQHIKTPKAIAFI